MPSFDFKQVKTSSSMAVLYIQTILHIQAYIHTCVYMYIYIYTEILSLLSLFYQIRYCYSLATDISKVTDELETAKGGNVKEVGREQAQNLQNKGWADVLKIRNASMVLTYIYSSSIHSNYPAHGLSTITS